LRIAIIGAGFAGLSVAWHVLQMGGCEVTLFDSKGIGGGASGIAAGLMHPYVGEEGRRSVHADEGMQASLHLIRTVEKEFKEKLISEEGILRHMIHEKQRQRFLAHLEQFDDIEQVGEQCFFLKSGVTLDCPRYLQGLWGLLRKRGAQLIISEITDLQALQGFDQIVVAAGAGIAGFPELKELRYSLLKGQVLHCTIPQGLVLPEKSVIAKGYIARAPQQNICHVGSTYERVYSDLLPSAALAKQLLFPPLTRFFPQAEQLEVFECKAAERVIQRGHYFPIAAQISKKLWVLSALGSRGLLYHALLGKQLAEALLSKNHSQLWSIKP
jgi:glycine/D-amino acid oxidase-like deaminating enzyme